ncbi:sugar transferase [[Clostridium] symbiosum]|uniref:sugar transferase n=1 Tax=Clostridium symbiosum TaxID=1512 RepID=UPI001D0687C2|nr:sugar transferase [[Clostridium] symbiosum]MCB6607636.1 sugar transferase [[Clostridium] symbiosum]MCB6929313.1 sugar transferase [[Clostridium] symbiosum]
MLCSWEKLPDFMRTKEVRPYYELLRKHRFGLLMKRTFDFVMSSIMLVLLAPVFLFLTIWIKTDSEGPIFYRQERVTQYGRIFRIYKFRTMVQNADKIGSLVTVGGDSRITKVGRKLRGCRLDELPQLINIWKGEMTFVGTRPEVAKYVKQYTKEMYATLLLPAGVTSEASIEFKDEDRLLNGVSGDEADRVYVGRVLPGKMRWNLEGIREFSLCQEGLILIRTLEAVLK